jgi:hypothetical protein
MPAYNRFITRVTKCSNKHVDTPYCNEMLTESLGD